MVTDPDDGDRDVLREALEEARAAGIGVQPADQDHEGRLRQPGRAARLEFWAG